MDKDMQREIRRIKKINSSTYSRASTPLPNAPAAYVFMPYPMSKAQSEYLRKYLDLLIEAGEYGDTTPPDSDKSGGGG